MKGEAQIAEALRAVEILRSSQWGSPEHGEANQFLFKLLEGELRQWVSMHPPGLADYDESSADRAVYLYANEIDPSVRECEDILLRNLHHFGNLVRKILRSSKTAKTRGEANVVASRHPEYPELLRQIREAKRAWNAEDAQIKRSHSFRVMGGLARLGSHWRMEYSRLVKKAQQMEQEAIGKVLTVHRRAR